MKSSFVIWDSKVVPHACVLKELVGVEKPYRLRKGLSVAADFPDDAAFTMNADFPNNILLTDNLINTDEMIVASAKLKHFLERQELSHLEYLPVTILNHKGKPASRDYFIVHPIDPVDCLDIKKSQPEWSAIDKTLIESVEKLVINEEVVKNRALFKPKSFYQVILTARRLSTAIDKEGFVGTNWIELDQYNS